MLRKLTPQSVDAIGISLKKRPENFKNWKKIFKKVEIFKAIVGKKVDLNSKKISPLVRFQINDISKNDTIFSIPSKGALGCYLSHVACLELCVKRRKPIVVIEEDVMFSTNAQKYIRKVFPLIPKKCDMLSLLYTVKGKTKSRGLVFSEIQGELNGALCYLITPKAAKIFLKYAFPIVTQFDLYLGIILTLDANVKGYILNKKLSSNFSIFLDNFSTDVQKFAVKKYLPSTNLFYVIVLSLVLLLVILCIWLIWKLSKKKSL